MGAEGAVNIIFKDQIAEADDPVAERARLIAEYEAEFNNPYIAAARGYIDDVILPSDTRPRLISALEMLARQAGHESQEEAWQHPSLRYRRVAPVFAQGRPFDRVLIANRGRDRPADHPGLSRDGDGSDRGLQRRGRPRPARPGGRPGRPDRPATGDRELSAGRRHRRGRARDRRPGGPSGLRLPRRASVVRGGRRGCRDGVRRVRTTGRSPPSATSWPRDGRRPAPSVPVVPGHARAGAGRPAGPGRLDHRRGRAASASRSSSRPPPGGGGRGMRRVTTAQELPAALLSGSREAASAFGDGSVYLEREILPARHIEVQLLGDAGRPGRRPRRARLLAPAAPPEAHRGGAGTGADRGPAARPARDGRPGRLGGRACATRRPASSCTTPTAGSGSSRSNTRLQVEHGVTELVSGLDIVREQFWLAAGAPLSERALRGRRAGGDPVEPRDRGPPVGRGPRPRSSRPLPVG